MKDKHIKCIDLLEQRESLEADLNQLTILLDVYKSNPRDHTVMFYKSGELEFRLKDIETTLRAVKSEYLELMTELATEYKY